MSTDDLQIFVRQQALLNQRRDLLEKDRWEQENAHTAHITSRQAAATSTLAPDQQSVVQSRFNESNEALTGSLEEHARTRHDQLTTSARTKAEQQKSRASDLASTIKRVYDGHAQLRSQWSRINPMQLKDWHLASSPQGTPESQLETAVSHASSAATKLDELGTPPTLSSKALRSAGGALVGIVGGVVGVIAAMIYGVIALIAFGWIGIIILLVIVTLMGGNFGDWIIGIVAVVAIIGFLWGVFGTASETEEDKVNRVKLQDGYSAYRQLEEAMTVAQRVYPQVGEKVKQTYSREKAEADSLYQDLLKRIEEYRSRLQQADASHENALAAFRQTKTTSLGEWQSALEEHKHHIETLGVITADWNAPIWKDYSPSNRNEVNTVPGVVRIGESDGVPIVAPMIGSGHLLILSDNNTKNHALQLLQLMVTRILMTFPVFSVRTVFVDPVGLGSNFPFKRLPDKIVGSAVYTDAPGIRQQLSLLIEHISRITQRYFGRDYDSIEDYNRDAKEVVEAYRLLCIADFPTKFERQELDSLVSVADRGTRTGIYLVIHINTDAEMPRGFDLELLKRNATVVNVRMTGDGTGTRTALYELQCDGASHLFMPDPNPNSYLFNGLMDRIAARTEEGEFAGVPFERIAPEPARWWQGDLRSLLEVPIGRSGARDLMKFWLGERPDKTSSYHALIAGRTGSGKSVLLHVLINSLALTYSPEELELYLVDFKQGVEFAIYADKGLPHARVIAIESEREFGLSVLRGLQSELERRSALFKADSLNTPNLASYRNETGAKLPRILLIIDEFQILFGGQDHITQAASALLENIVKQGRSYGIHVIMGSQSLKGADIKNALDQFATRIALQLSEGEADLLLGSGGASLVKSLERPGAVIYNHDFVQTENARKGQVALLSKEFILSNLEKVHALPYRRSEPPIIFNGSRASNIADNRLLEALYKRADQIRAPEARTLLGVEDWEEDETPALLWLGEAIEIKPHTAAVFRRVSRSNLLLVGDYEETIFGMLGASMISLAAFYRPGEAQFRIIDLSLKSSEWADTAEDFQEAFAFHDVVVKEKRGAAFLLEEVYMTVQQRQERRKMGEEHLGPSVFVFVGGIHKFEELRTIPNRGREEMSEYAGKLLHIIRNGPELGVHTILWSDSLDTLKDRFDRNSQVQLFDWRAALNMSDDKLREILNNQLPGTLQKYRAFLFNARVSSEFAFEKFKPYSLPHAREERHRLFQHYGKLLARQAGQTVTELQES